ncbi:MAG: ABC transporter ATP-binding protein [Planctomycetota bacterium]|nr:ABC transporter ATP-binding protein [Planctomycetota bacterium]
MASVRLMKRLFLDSVKGRRVAYGFAVAAMACVAGSTAGLAWLMRSAINDVFVHRDLRAMWLVAFGILLLSVVKGAADYFQAVAMTRISNGIEATFQRRMFDKLLELKISYFTRIHSSKSITNINNNAKAATEALNLLTTGIGRDLLTLLGLAVVMVAQDPLLTGIALLIGPVIVVGTQQIMRKLRKLADSEYFGMAQVTAAVQETCQGIRTVKSFNLEPLMRSRLSAAVADVEKRRNTIASVGKLTSPLMETLGGFAIAAMIVYAGWQTVENGKTPGEFMAFMTAFLLAYEPAKKLASLLVNLTRKLTRVQRMYDMLELTSTENYECSQSSIKSAGGNIVMSGVSFGYGRTKVLHDVSLHIECGEIVALVGPSGAGKSTIFSLLQRFYDPGKGSIQIDGIDIACLAPRVARQLTSVVSQDTTLFSGTIEDNIRLGRSDATRGEVETAAKAAAAYEFISSMPRGFDTLVGERHTTLSGGQAQRLAIARAVLKDAPILLLDEATSALDAETEREVQDALEKLMRGRTTVVIAHRPSTIERAHRAYVLQEGHVVEAGSHDDLLRVCPLYRQLFGNSLSSSAA